MKIQKLITFSAFILYSLVVIYFLLTLAQVREIFQEFSAKNYLLSWVVSFIVPLILALGSLRFWFYLKSKERRGEMVRLVWPVSIFLLVSPVIIFYVIIIIVNIMIYNINSSL